MPFIARPALIHRHAPCFELRVLIKIFPGIILRLISHLSFPGVLLASVVFWVRLKRWNLVEVFVSFVTHVLFFCVVLLVVLSEESRLRQLHFDAIASLVVILLVELEADEVALLTDGCNGGGAAAHTVV